MYCEAGYSIGGVTLMYCEVGYSIGGVPLQLANQNVSSITMSSDKFSLVFRFNDFRTSTSLLSGGHYISDETFARESKLFNYCQ
jgi:hypothetical protein